MHAYTVLSSSLQSLKWKDQIEDHIFLNDSLVFDTKNQVFFLVLIAHSVAKILRKMADKLRVLGLEAFQRFAYTVRDFLARF